MPCLVMWTGGGAKGNSTTKADAICLRLSSVAYLQAQCRIYTFFASFKCVHVCVCVRELNSCEVCAQDCPLCSEKLKALQQGATFLKSEQTKNESIVGNNLNCRRFSKFIYYVYTYAYVCAKHIYNNVKAMSLLLLLLKFRTIKRHKKCYPNELRSL